jgi:hypothetical protein
MVNQNLVVFIRDSLSRGIDINVIRSELLQQGYSPNEVDESVSFVLGGGREVHHTINFSKSALIAIVAIVLAVALSSYLVIELTGSKPPSKLLDFESFPLKTSVRAGEVLEFQVRFFNMGNSNRYDVTVNAQIIDADNKVVGQKEDTFAVEKRTTETMQIELPPGLAVGTYSVKSKATYANGEALSSFEFRVYKESATATCFDNLQNQGETGLDCGGPCKPCATCADRKKNQAESGIDCGGPCSTDCCANGYQDKNLGEGGVDCGGPCKACGEGCGSCDDGNPCTEDLCKGAECAHTMVTPCCGNGICDAGENEQTCADDCKPIQPEQTPKEIIERAGLVSKTDVKRANDICVSLREVRDKDRCFEVVANSVNQSLVCDNILSVSKRDACYMNFAMPPNNDYSVCEKVENQYLKKSCESLKYIHTNK